MIWIWFLWKSHFLIFLFNDPINPWYSSMIFNDMAMDQYLYIPFLGGWTSINPSYFEVNYRGTIGFDPSPYYLFFPQRNELGCVPHGHKSISCLPLGWELAATSRKELIPQSLEHPQIHASLVYLGENLPMKLPGLEPSTWGLRWGPRRREAKALPRQSEDLDLDTTFPWIAGLTEGFPKWVN